MKKNQTKISWMFNGHEELNAVRTTESKQQTKWKESTEVDKDQTSDEV